MDRYTQRQKQSKLILIYYVVALLIDSNTSQAVFRSRSESLRSGKCSVLSDYDLITTGPFFVAHGSQALVAKLEDRFCQAWDPYRTEWLVLIPSKHDATAYERIGLLVYNGSLDAAYDNSPEMDIKII
jgi:hypothetical protein